MSFKNIKVNLKSIAKHLTEAIKQYGKDGREQFARAINAACAGQFVRAGHMVTGTSNAAIVVSSNNVGINLKAIERVMAIS